MIFSTAKRSGATAGAGGTQAPAADALNVLLVDDQLQRLLSYEAILAPLGQNLIRANSGREALDILLRTDIAVVLMDVVMPEMDGFEMASVIQAHPRFRNVPIIFVTAVSTSDLERLKGYELGALDYVCVPIVPEILRAKVAVFLDLHRKTRELQQLNRDLEERVNQRTQALESALATLESHTAKLEAEIAERQRLEDALRDQATQLEDADRRKDNFLAMLAHELRNPLAPLRNALQIMRMPGIDPIGIRESQQIMERQIEQLVRVVDDLLDVARIMRDKIELCRDRFDFSDVVSRAVETVQSVFASRSQGFEVSLPNDSIYVEGDLIRLSQVICNLLMNAAKYTEERGRITLAVEREGPNVLVRVTDTGIGIAPELLPHVFDLFVQADRSLARSQGGLGIGLTLVRRLVEMHGGSVSASSRGLGQGSEFVVRLPTVQNHVENPPTRDASDRPPTVRRVLVVDDNVDAARSAAMLLTSVGHEVELAHDGVAALEAAARFRPEIILLDIGLPGMSGYDVAMSLRADPEHRRTILAAVTGYGQEDDRRRTREAGFDCHLTKPVAPDWLLNFVAAPDAVT